jgi:hypothetical protein
MVSRVCLKSLIKWAFDILKNLPISTRVLNYRYGLWLIICFGVLLRVLQYAANRSLWLDEALIARNIFDREFLGLFKTLDYNQAAPIGFLILTKTSVYFFGNNEYALRLVPLMSAIAGLILFYRLLTKYCSPHVSFIALFLFSLGGPLIYYSSEVKPYSGDVAIALAIYLMASQMVEKDLNAGRIVFYSFLGALFLIFSFPSVFVLLGVACSLTFCIMSKKEPSKAWRFFIVFLLWGLTFVGEYQFVLTKLKDNKALFYFWQAEKSFMPLLPLSFTELSWYPTKWIEVFKNPGGLHFAGVGAFIGLLGGFHLFRNRPILFFGFAFPIVFAMLASSINYYPFSSRMLLYSSPALICFVSEGISSIIKKKKIILTFLGLAVSFLLFIHPVYFAIYHIVAPRKHQEIKPLMEYVRNNFQHNDTIYVYHPFQHAFIYYAAKYGLENKNPIFGCIPNSDWSNVTEELHRLRGNNRVWMIFSGEFG